MRSSRIMCPFHVYSFPVFILLFSSGEQQEVIRSASNVTTKESKDNLSATLLQLLQRKEHVKYIRPSEGGEPVKVRVGVHIIYLGNFRESDMEYTIEMYFRQYWKDSRLATNLNHSVTFSGETLDILWQPDTFFENAVSSRLHYITILNKYVRLYPDGNLLVSTRLTISCSCNMDFRKFPMDTQICDLYFGSYGFTTRDLIYGWNDEFVSFPRGREIAQFSLVEFTYLNGTSTFVTGNFSHLGIRFVLARRLGFYLTKVYIPSVLVVLVSWLSFFIDKKSAPARVSLGITTVLTMTTLIMGFGQGALPMVSYVRALDWYLIGCYLMVFGSFAEYAAVSYISLRTTNKSSENESEIICSHEADPLPLEKKRKEVACSKVGAVTENGSSGNLSITFYKEKLLRIKQFSLDQWSQLMFLPAFIILNLFYWLYYLVLAR